MIKIYRNYKKLSLWMLLLTQMLLILSYFFLKIDSDPFPNEKISFVEAHNEEQPKYTYHISSRIFLKSIDSRTKFMDFNSSLCYTNGTDLVSMKRSKDANWECSCLPGWHGKDCGQPEVVWRAFLTYRKPLKIAGPRTFERRILYIFQVDKFSETITEIRINELGGIVDLFILYEADESDFLQSKLRKNFVREFHDKILYLNQSCTDNFLYYVRNIRDDDIILTSDKNEIPNKFAINFLKLYDNWPEPVLFRLRWSVFGFFWTHPSKTLITGGVSSVSFFKENLNSKLQSLTLPIKNKGIILGDLNHYGGWYCEYCNDVNQIIESLSTQQRLNLTKIGRQKIDDAFIEDVIENGLYVDGKTELQRSRRYHDTYFAPFHVTENDWKYDLLLINMYSKLDYY